MPQAFSLVSFIPHNMGLLGDSSVLHLRASVDNRELVSMHPVSARGLLSTQQLLKDAQG